MSPANLFTVTCHTKWSRSGGQSDSELVAFHWTGLFKVLCTPTRVWFNDLNHESLSRFAQILNLINDNYFLSTDHLCTFNLVNFVTWWSHCRTLWVSQNTVAQCRYAYLSHEGRRRLLEGREKIAVHQNSPHQATQYIGNWAWTFRWVTGSPDYFQSQTKQ